MRFLAVTVLAMLLLASCSTVSYTTQKSIVLEKLGYGSEIIFAEKPRGGDTPSERAFIAKTQDGHIFYVLMKGEGIIKLKRIIM